MTEPLSLEQMKANRKLWVDALRSGKYRQAREDGTIEYCCLGVLSLLAKQLTARCTGFEPTKAREFVGLAVSGGVYDRDALWRMNDAGSSFAAIADIIEAEPPGLFIDTPGSTRLRAAAEGGEA